jgi:hypothetical protein
LLEDWKCGTITQKSNSFGSKHTLRHLAAFEAVTKTSCHGGGGSLDLGLAARACDGSLGRRNSFFGHDDDVLVDLSFSRYRWTGMVFVNYVLL